VLCNLVSIARRVGAARIVPTRGIPYPTGDPSLDAERERAWRRALLERALEAVSTPVSGTTIFDPATERQPA
jgi:glycine reductase